MPRPNSITNMACPNYIMNLSVGLTTLRTCPNHNNKERSSPNNFKNLPSPIEIKNMPSSN